MNVIHTTTPDGRDSVSNQVTSEVLTEEERETLKLIADRFIAKVLRIHDEQAALLTRYSATITEQEITIGNLRGELQGLSDQRATISHLEDALDTLRDTLCDACGDIAELLGEEDE